MKTLENANGVAKKSPTKKTATVNKPKIDVSPILKPQDEALKKMVTFQQMIDRVTELQKMVKNYEKISETLKEVQKFKVGAGETVEFTLNDHTNNNLFTTLNTNLVTMVVKILSAKLKEKQAELVDKILQYEI